MTDTCTGLMWRKDTAGDVYDWRDAINYCENLSYSGYRDWRLPNLRELQSIVDYGRKEPALDPLFRVTVIPGHENLQHWSSTTTASILIHIDSAWDVPFHTGEVHSDFKSGRRMVRAVRTIQPGE